MPQNQAADTIGQLVAEYRELAQFLDSAGEYSLKLSVDSSFAKTLVVSAASYFESRLTESLIDLYSEQTNLPGVLVHFVRNLAIERRYFQWFDWGSSNANSFFGKFGGEFRAYMRSRVGSDECLQNSIKAFIELENLRNDLVHGNYATFQLNLSVDEILSRYEKAVKFVEGFPEEIRAYLSR